MSLAFYIFCVVEPSCRRVAGGRMAGTVRAAADAVRATAAQYDGMLSRKPFRTSTITGAILGWAGDALTQRRQMLEQAAEHRQSMVQHPKPAEDRPIDVQPAMPEHFDVRRSLVFTVFSAYMSGPVNYVWLVQLHRAVAYVAPNGGARALVAKMALQASFLQPLIFLPSYFAFNGVVRGWSRQETLERARREYWPTLQYVWVFWTPAVAFAFGVLPMRQQPAFFALVGFAWNACLSAFSNPRKSPHIKALQDGAALADSNG